MASFIFGNAVDLVARCDKISAGSLMLECSTRWCCAFRGKAAAFPLKLAVGGVVVEVSLSLASWRVMFS